MVDEERTTIYVGNLPLKVKQADLMAAFIPFGEINAILMPEKIGSMGGPIGQSQNFALIEFDEGPDCEHAIFNMNDNLFFGKVLTVHWAKNSHRQLLLASQQKQSVWKQQNQLKTGAME